MVGGPVPADGPHVKLERTLPAVWQLRGGDVPALATVTSRARTVVVDDVEYLCSAIVREVGRSRAPYAPRSFAQMDDLVAFLLGQVEPVAGKYDPTKGTQVHDPFTHGFKAWFYVELKRDAIDECRSRFGRDGHKHDLIDLRPYQRAEEAERAAEIDQPDPLEDGIRSFSDRLVDSFDGVADDDPDDWFDGREWAHLRRDRKAAWQKQAVGVVANQRVEGRDPTADEREERAA